VTNEGRGTGYRFMGKFFLYPLNFTEQEALVFSLLPSMLDKDKLPPGFDTAYDKLWAHISRRSRAKITSSRISPAL
jgi:predicted DNA-binding transcriptional regulator YafY